MDDAAHALVYTEPGKARIEQVDPGNGSVLVRSLFGALSRGTERLIFQGAVPVEEFTRMRAPLQHGDFPFPVRYGYAVVGRVLDGPANLTGRHVFCLHPHQDLFRVDPEWLIPLPGDVPAHRAVLAANTETALNAIWDAQLRPGARCLVVGAGLVGWMVTALLSRSSTHSVAITDIRPETGVKADDFSVKFVSPGTVRKGAYDVVFHTSASSAGLQTAIDSLDFEGTVIEMSWYGSRPSKISLGGNFHANRVRIVSSQVGTVAPARRVSTSRRDRLSRALAMLADASFDSLITETVRFRDLPAALPRLLAPDAAGIATAIDYAAG